MPSTLRQPAAATTETPHRATRSGVRLAFFIFVAVLWLGFLLGVSFLATPVKFHAPTLDLPTALDVGRVTFALFARTEWVLCALLAAAALLLPGPWFRAGAGVLVLVVVMQALWLLPILDERILRIIAGEAVPATYHHVLYIVVEACKALLLLLLSIAALWRVAAAREGA